MTTLPDFMIIGAMKCATSSLQEQLVHQPGIFMTTPKEPCFFSDDDVYAQGMNWYSELYAGAQEGDLLGEASTHYTKLPTYPQTLTRLQKVLKAPKFVYVMREPIDRLTSQYIHEWSQNIVNCGIDESIDQHPELAAYSSYASQLEPFFEAYGKESVLPVFFGRLKTSPQEELERVCKFIGYKGEPKWVSNLKPANVSKNRVRRFPGYAQIIDSKAGQMLRRNLVPKTVRTMIRDKLTMKTRPELSLGARQRLEVTFDKDLAILGSHLGVELNCRNFSKVTSQSSLEWSL